MTTPSTTSTMAATPTTSTTTGADGIDRPVVLVAEVLSTIDVLLARTVTLAVQVAEARARLDDLVAERRLREAMATCGVEGKNETERQARLRLQLAGDDNISRLADAERQTRLELARREAERWATRMKVHTCLALLRLAGGDAEALTAPAAPAEGTAPRDAGVPAPEPGADPSGAVTPLT